MRAVVLLLLLTLSFRVFAGGADLQAFSSRIAKQVYFEDGLLDEPGSVRGFARELIEARRQGRLTLEELRALTALLDERQPASRGSLLALADILYAMAQERALTPELTARLKSRIENRRQEYRRHLRLIERTQAGHALPARDAGSALLEKRSRNGGAETVHLKHPVAAFGMVKVGSTYTDAKEALPALEQQGTGHVVRLEKTGKAVILTAAHVVGGRNAWAEIGGRRVPVTNLLLDNDRDVALLEVADLAASLAALDYTAHGTLLLSRALAERSDEGRIPWVRAGSYARGHRELVFALPPWAADGVQEAGWTLSDQDTVTNDSDNQFVRLFTRVTGGTSGSVVIERHTDLVMGLISQSHLYLNGSYLIPLRMLKADLDLFLAGRRGSLTATRWKMHKGLVYRDFGQGVEDISYLNGNPVGKGVFPSPDIPRPLPGGPGDPPTMPNFPSLPSLPSFPSLPSTPLSTPPTLEPEPLILDDRLFAPAGKGVIGQPGKGVIGQPGKGVIGQPSSSEEEFSPWSASPREVFARYGLKPGIQWKGRTVIAVRAVPVQKNKNWPDEFVLAADANALRFMSAEKDGFRFTPLFEGEIDFIDLLRRRTGQGTGPLRQLPLAAPWSFEGAGAEISSVSLSESGIHIRLQTISRFKNLRPETDWIEFTLDRRGGWRGNEYFPVLEVEGSRLRAGKKTRYHVDLRALFFSDLSDVSRAFHESHELQGNFGVFDLTTRARLLISTHEETWTQRRARQLSLARLSVRSKDSGLQFDFTFGAPNTQTAASPSSTALVLMPKNLSCASRVLDGACRLVGLDDLTDADGGHYRDLLNFYVERH